MAYTRAVANTHVKIAGTWYAPGDEVDISAIGDDYSKNLVDSGKIALDNPSDVAALVDGAPATLDTLNELAAAINDDPTFYNTVTAHASSDGSSHTFIDQDVTSGSAPVFDATNFTNLPASVSSLDDLSDAAKFGTANMYIGTEAPVSHTSGTYNLAISNDPAAPSLASLTSGTQNVAIGREAGEDITDGGNNVMIGWRAGKYFTGSDWNTAVGNLALGGGSASGGYNTAYGYASLQYAATSAARNTGVGYNAFNSLTSGVGNTAIGEGAGYVPAGLIANASTTASNQTLIGRYTGQSTTTARNSIVAIGYNVAAGDEVGAIVIGSSEATGNILRVESGVLSVGGVNWVTSIDGLSDAENDVSNNLYLGTTVPGTASGATDNVAISGDGTALDALTTGDHNVAIGTGAGSEITTGSYSINIGRLAGSGQATNSANIHIGHNARPSSGTQNSYVVVGSGAVAHSNSVVIGQSAHTEAGSSVAIGQQASTTVLGVSVGHFAGASLISSGQQNTLIGANAGYYGTALTTGDYNIAIGSGARFENADRNDAIVIGYSLSSGAEDGSIAIGSNNVPGNIIRVESGKLTVGAIPGGKMAVTEASTGPVTLTAADEVHVATSGTYTVNLPAISGNIGVKFIIKNQGAGVITVDGNGAETIDGAATQTLNQYESLTIVCTTAEWSIL